MKKKIVFCSHAEDKFALLKEHRFPVSKKNVIETLNFPEKTERGYKNRWVNQKAIDKTHVLRVVYEKREDDIFVITFYPGRRSFYES